MGSLDGAKLDAIRDYVTRLEAIGSAAAPHAGYVPIGDVTAELRRVLDYAPPNLAGVRERSMFELGVWSARYRVAVPAGALVSSLLAEVIQLWRENGGSREGLVKACGQAWDTFARLDGAIDAALDAAARAVAGKTKQAADGAAAKCGEPGCPCEGGGASDGRGY